MKKYILIFVIMLTAIHSIAIAQNMKDLMKEADKLSYKGQLDHAKELMGQVEKDAEGKNTSQDEGDSMSFMFTMMVWGSIGTGYFMYGKSQSKYVFILCGIALCVLPIFISSATANVVLGLILIVVPFKISG